jgi:hypothetical protein
VVRYILIPLVALTVAEPSAQRPNIQNGNVQTRPAASLTREVSAAGSSGTPVWIAWSVPMVPGDRSLCSTWSDGFSFVRGETLGPMAGSRPTAPTPPAGPVRLDSGTALVLLVRVIDGRPERIRSIGDDCPIDATDVTVHWLTGVSPAESVQYLDSLTRSDALNISTNRRVAEAAVAAIALHQDAAATPVLERLSSAATADAGLRRQAASGLSAHRGAPGLDRVAALIAAERNRDLRRSFVGALAQSPQDKAVGVLLNIARADADPGVRGEAALRYIRRAGEPGLSTALQLLEKDPDEDVKRRIVSGIGSLPEAIAAPALIQLAKTHSSVTVRKEAVSTLGRFSDPQARALLEELLK